MKVNRTKYERTTPKTHEKYSSWNINMGDGIDRLLSAVTKVIEKIFGLHYMNRLHNVFA